MDFRTEYKQVGSNGQISIGKDWAGRLVRVTTKDNGIEIVPGEFIPESQRIFFTDQAQKQLKNFDEWAEKNPPQKTDLKALKKKLRAKIKK